MTMLSFRVPEADAEEAGRWAASLGIDRSELLRQALRRHLSALRGADDASAWQRTPLTDEESAIDALADWGPAEDWSDWFDAAR